MVLVCSLLVKLFKGNMIKFDIQDKRKKNMVNRLELYIKINYIGNLKKFGFI